MDAMSCTCTNGYSWGALLCTLCNAFTRSHGPANLSFSEVTVDFLIRRQNADAGPLED